MGGSGPGRHGRAHDVIVHDGPAALSVELKAWKRHRSGDIVAVLRPAQVRLHRVAAQEGWASGVVFGVIGEPDIYAVRSCFLPEMTPRLLDRLQAWRLPPIDADGPRAFKQALHAVLTERNPLTPDADQ